MEGLKGLDASGRSVAPTDKRHISAADVSTEGKATFGSTDRTPWWSVGTKVTSIGAPVGVGVIHPELGEAVIVIIMFVALTIIATALFGSCELSKRAFRLMRWIGNRPEPQSPLASNDGARETFRPADRPGTRQTSDRPENDR